MAASRMVERIIVAGMTVEPKSITEVGTGAVIAFTFDPNRGVLVMRQPNVSMLREWSILVALKGTTLCNRDLQ